VKAVDILGKGGYLKDKINELETDMRTKLLDIYI
jgi:hypothetical protein